MNKKIYAEILDEFFDLNAMLEICQESTQADEPNMKTLDVVLYNQHTGYVGLYEKMVGMKEGAAE